MRLIAFLSDFGLRDYYVGAVKAVVKRLCPLCEVIDITHEVGSWSLLEAEYILSCCYDDFPEGTVFLVVVDPGVGTSRKAIVVKTRNYWFVGPDNGVLVGVAEREGSFKAWAIEKVPFTHKHSYTFHGRDIFAPVAAYIAQGGSVEDIGSPLTELVHLEKPPTGVADGKLSGYVAHIDKFGNVATSITGEMLRRAGADVGSTLLVSTPRGVHRLRLRRTFGEVAEGELFALVNSCGRLEFAVNKGSASEAMKAEVGDAVEVRVA